MSLFQKIENGDIPLKKADKEQDLLISDLGTISSGNSKYKEKYQLDVIKNVRNLHNSRQKIIDLLIDNAKIRSEAIYKTKQNKKTGTGLKILTPKQMLQRLPIALAQVKAGHDSKGLLNEIRQIVYSLYQSNEITKKVYNNIIKSIK